MSFNRELIEHSLAQQGVEISDETAEEYLGALADLYEAFTELVQNKK